MNKLFTLCTVALLSTAVVAEPDKHHHQHPKQSESKLELTETASKLLREEMGHVQAAMQALIPAIAQADWQQIHQLGNKIKSTFIFKQKMPEHELHLLHQSLPQGFKELDHKFHYYAGMMAHVAEKGDMELTQFYFTNMLQSCTSCHSKYATHRFPGHQKQNKHKGKDHH